MIQFHSQIPYNLGWSVFGFTSVFRYQILNRNYKLFAAIIIIILLLLLLLLLLLFLLLLLLL